MNSKKTLNTLLAGAVAVSAMGTLASVSPANAMGKEKDKEKCYGVVKAGKNACGSADKAHGCAGLATVDGSGAEWVYLPKGTCEKLVGGSLEPVMEKGHDDKTEHQVIVMNKPATIPHTMQAFSSVPPDQPLTDPVGIGLRAPHYEEIIETKPKLGWIEVHPENYFCGGVHKHFLDQISSIYPISLHGVGLSLGSDEAISQDHLKQFKELIDRYQPFNVSDHVAWSASGNAHLNDLLPLPYNTETLEKLKDNIKATQDFFGRAILVENPSTYIAFKDNEMSEQDFMNILCEQAECFMLLDINNIYVQSHNHGLDPYEYIDAINPAYVREMHLAGHIERSASDHTILVDTHNQEVCDDVWTLYEHAVKHLGVIPTLIEWDQDFPPLQTLLDEAEKARSIIKAHTQQEQTHAVE